MAAKRVGYDGCARLRTICSVWRFRGIWSEFAIFPASVEFMDHFTS